jgi:electron transport complex protein RnfC
MKAGTFNGGLAFQAKGMGKGSFEAVPAPSRIIIPLKQDSAKPCSASVKKGASIKKGDIIGESELSAVHAPVSGKVIEVKKRFPHPSGEFVSAIDIESDGKQAATEEVIESLDPLELAQKNGLTDMQGAGLPLKQKIEEARKHSVQSIVINAVDEEPWFSSRTLCFYEQALELDKGVQILKELLDVSNVYIASYEQAPSNLPASAGQVVTLPPRHPQSLPELIAKAVLGREIPSERSAEAVGTSIFDVETVCALARTMENSQPLLERYISVWGASWAAPRNFRVPIGTRIGDLLKSCGVKLQDVGKVVSGGPLMGQALQNFDLPVTKETRGIFFEKKEEVVDLTQEGCIKCGDCVEVCPMGLMPFLLSGFSEAEQLSMTEKHDIFSCVECGCCAYICPVRIPLVQWIQFGKASLRAQEGKE